jgi:DNA-directed RNA polymerase subunit RPC12/RpoP
MPKIIQYGSVREKTALHKCGECSSLVEYYEGDIETDQRNESYVRCPLCLTWIDARVLDWSKKAGR